MHGRQRSKSNVGLGSGAISIKSRDLTMVINDDDDSDMSSSDEEEEEENSVFDRDPDLIPSKVGPDTAVPSSPGGSAANRRSSLSASRPKSKDKRRSNSVFAPGTTKGVGLWADCISVDIEGFCISECRMYICSQFGIF